jgi:hypothetical protein
MMTRKDYVGTAEILKDMQDRMDEVNFSLLISKFGVMFGQDNPRFDFQKFMSACYEEK